MTDPVPENPPKSANFVQVCSCGGAFPGILRDKLRKNCPLHGEPQKATYMTATADCTDTNWAAEQKAESPSADIEKLIDDLEQKVTQLVVEGGERYGSFGERAGARRAARSALLDGVRKLVAEKDRAIRQFRQALENRDELVSKTLDECDRLRSELSQARSGKLAVTEAEYDAVAELCDIHLGVTARGTTAFGYTPRYGSPLRSLLSRLLVRLAPSKEK